MLSRGLRRRRADEHAHCSARGNACGDLPNELASEHRALHHRRRTRVIAVVDADNLARRIEARDFIALLVDHARLRRDAQTAERQHDG